MERRFRICDGFFEIFRSAFVNALGQVYRPGRCLHKETRKQIIHLYLTGEGPTAISREVRLTPDAVVSFDIMKRSVNVRRSVKSGNEVTLLNFQTTF